MRTHRIFLTRWPLTNDVLPRVTRAGVPWAMMASFVQMGVIQSPESLSQNPHRTSPPPLPFPVSPLPPCPRDAEPPAGTRALLPSVPLGLAPPRSPAALFLPPPGGASRSCDVHPSRLQD